MIAATRTRRFVQIGFVAATVAAGWRLGGAGVEAACPFGAVETAWALVTGGTFACTTGELNLAIFLGVVVVTLISRKAFCGWVCPLGAISEWLDAVRRRIPGLRRVSAPPRIDAALRWLRLPLLLLILWATWTAGELVFRGYDPYYVLFSFGGHEVKWWSWLVLGAVLALMLVLPMAWCRWLCPLGATLWPLARPGVLRVARNPAACSSCRSCDRACPQGLAVSTVPAVRSGDCTACLECVAACADRRALSMELPPVAGPAGRSVHWAVVPVVLAVAAAGAVAAAPLLAVPSVQTGDAGPSPDGSATATLHVAGVRCARTAAAAVGLLEGEPGVLRVRAFAARGDLEVTYDPALTDAGTVRAAVEGPLFDERTGEFRYGVFRVTEVDGTPVPPP
jgi:NAD-dependent dihydropyrimidine dehydrogenase PreA subunit